MISGHWLQGGKLYVGRAETEAVPRQAVSFLFARIPSAEIVEEIERAIAALLDRSLCP